MARTRYLKPGFFTNDRVARLSPLARLAWQGLWCVADREGRLKDRPVRLKIEILPYDDCNFDALLNELAGAGFIVRYEADGEPFIWLPSFVEHQKPHIKEAPSTYPAPIQSSANPVLVQDEHRSSPGTRREHAGASTVLAAQDGDGDGDGNGDANPGSAAAAEDNPDFVVCLRAWENATGYTVTGQLGDKIADALGEHSLEWVLDAIRETGDAQAKSWKYTAAILATWKRDGRKAKDAPKPAKHEPYRLPDAKDVLTPTALDFMDTNDPEFIRLTGRLP